jgi:hypothetical protein
MLSGTLLATFDRRHCFGTDDNDSTRAGDSLMAVVNSMARSFQLRRRVYTLAIEGTEVENAHDLGLDNREVDVGLLNFEG